MKFLNPKISLTISFSVMLMLLLVLTISGLFWLNTLADSKKAIREQHIKINLATEMYNADREYFINLQQMLMNPLQRKKIYGEFETLEDRFLQIYNKLLKMNLTTQERAHFRQVITMAKSAAIAQQAFAEILVTVQAGELDSFLQEHPFPKKPEVIESFNHLITTQKQALHETEQQLFQATEKFYLLIILFSILGIILTGSIIWITFYHFKQLEQRLLQTKEIVIAAHKAKSDFLANMSHKIRTPLNAVMGMSHLLLETQLTSEQFELVETVRTSGDAFLKLIDDILDFSKIEAGELALEIEPFELRETLNTTLNKFTSKAATKYLELTLKIDDDIPNKLLGDVTRLRQIIEQLLDNAVKFTDKGEINVWLSSRLLNKEQIELHFHVKDTGVGIPVERMDRLFESFHHIDSFSTPHTGPGLGLVIGKQLCQLMGGTLWVERNPDQGSTFHFTVIMNPLSKPLLEKEKAYKEPTSTTKQSLSSSTHSFNVQKEANKMTPARILLVEDNLTNQKVAQLILKRLGYSADIANNGLEAVQAVEQHVYDVILMDIQMPELDGLEATRRIHERWPPKQRPYIIATTAHALHGDRETCLAAGMNDYVPKPVRPEELAAALERWKQFVEKPHDET